MEIDAVRDFSVLGYRHTKRKGWLPDFAATLNQEHLDQRDSFCAIARTIYPRDVIHSPALTAVMEDQMVGNPTHRGEYYPGGCAYHLTTSTVLAPEGMSPLIPPEALSDGPLTLSTRKPGIDVLYALGLPEGMSSIGASGRMEIGLGGSPFFIWAAPNVSQDLAQMHREGTFVRPDNAIDLVTAVAVLAMQGGKHAYYDRATDIFTYLAQTERVPQWLAARSLVNLGISVDNIVSDDAVQCALRALGITGFWEKEAIQRLRKHTDIEQPLLSLDLIINSILKAAAIPRSPLQSAHIPLVAEIDMASPPSPAAYTISRPPSIAALSHVENSRIKTLYYFPEDEEKLVTRLVAYHATHPTGGNDIYWFPRTADWGRAGNAIPVKPFENSGIPTIDRCVSRYPNTRALIKYWFGQLRKGEAAFLIQSQSRAERIRAVAESVGLQVSDKNLRLLRNGLFPNEALFWRFGETDGTN